MALLIVYACIIVMLTAALIRRRRNRNERGEVMVRKRGPVAEQVLEEIFIDY